MQRLACDSWQRKYLQKSIWVSTSECNRRPANSQNLAPPSFGVEANKNSMSGEEINYIPHVKSQTNRPFLLLNIYPNSSLHLQENAPNFTKYELHPKLFFLYNNSECYYYTCKHDCSEIWLLFYYYYFFRLTSSSSINQNISSSHHHIFS